jgi:hypothetical protein
MARLKCWTPDLARDRDGNFIPNPNKRLAYERQPRKTPVYSILRESEPRRSIVLQPLQSLPELRQETAVFGQGSSSAIPSNFNTLSQGNKGKPSNKRMRPEDDVKYPQIILSVRLDKAQVDIPAWLEFIRAFPPEGQDIKIDGIYDSFSTLLLIRIPVAVWDLLPAHSAYSFVGFVTSENKIHDMEAEVQTRADSDTPISESGSATSMDRIPLHVSMRDVEMPENGGVSISQVESFSKRPQVSERNIYPNPSISSASVHGSQSPATVPLSPSNTVIHDNQPQSPVSMSSQFKSSLEPWDSRNITADSHSSSYKPKYVYRDVWACVSTTSTSSRFLICLV